LHQVGLSRIESDIFSGRIQVWLIWLRFVFLPVGRFHNILPPRILYFSIWVRFVKTCFLTGTSPTRVVHFPMKKRGFRVLAAIIIWVRFATSGQGLLFHAGTAGVRMGKQNHGDKIMMLPLLCLSLHGCLPVFRLLASDF